MGSINAFAAFGNSPDPGAQISTAAAIQAQQDLIDREADVVEDTEAVRGNDESFGDSTSEQAESRPPADPNGRGQFVDTFV